MYLEVAERCGSVMLWKSDDATVWLNPIDAAIISSLPSVINFETKTLLEIGVYRGGGLVRTFLQNNILWDGIGIDPYPGLEHEKVRSFEVLEEANVRSRFELLHDWEVLLARQVVKKASLIHIDGEHSESGAFYDLANTLKIASSSGIMIVDDFMARIFPGVTSVVFKFLDRFDYAALLISPAKIFLCKSELHQEYQEKLQELISKLDLEYSHGFPRGLYGLDYDQPSLINGRTVLIVENQRYTSTFINILGITNKNYSFREVFFQIVRQSLPPFVYAQLRRLFKVAK